MYNYVYQGVDRNSDKYTHKGSDKHTQRGVDKGVYICYILIGGGNNGNNYFCCYKRWRWKNNFIL